MEQHSQPQSHSMVEDPSEFILHLNLDLNWESVCILFMSDELRHSGLFLTTLLQIPTLVLTAEKRCWNSKCEAHTHAHTQTQHGSHFNGIMSLKLAELNRALLSFAKSGFNIHTLSHTDAEWELIRTDDNCSAGKKTENK